VPGPPCIPAQPHLSPGSHTMGFLSPQLCPSSPLPQWPGDSWALGLQGQPRRKTWKPACQQSHDSKQAPHRATHSCVPDIVVVLTSLAIMKEVSVFLVINLSLRNGPPYGGGYTGHPTHTVSKLPLCVYGAWVGKEYSSRMLGWELGGG
jgi:hypothetical protein